MEQANSKLKAIYLKLYRDGTSRVELFRAQSFTNNFSEFQNWLFS